MRRYRRGRIFSTIAMIDLPLQFSYLCDAAEKWGGFGTLAALDILIEGLSDKDLSELDRICLTINERNHWEPIIEWVREKQPEINCVGGFYFWSFLVLLRKLSALGKISFDLRVLDSLDVDGAHESVDWKVIPDEFGYLADAAIELGEACGNEDPLECLSDFDMETRDRLGAVASKVFAKGNLEAFRAWTSTQEDKQSEAVWRILVLIEVLDQLGFSDEKGL